MLAADLMTPNVAFVSPEQRLSDAAELMWRRDCGALPVVNADGTVVGMVTDRDICMATWSRGLPPDEVRVAAAMSPRVITCRSDDSALNVEAAMRSNRVRRLPVVDENQHLVGIVSLADLAKSADGTPPHDRAQPRSQDVAATLAVICHGADGMPARSTNVGSSTSSTVE